MPRSFVASGARCAKASVESKENVFFVSEKWPLKKGSKTTTNQPHRQVYRNLNYLTSGKESQRNSYHFGPQLIENGQFGAEL